MENLSSKIKNVEILAPFRPILDGEHIYYVYSSGRGQGKSQNIVRSLLILAATMKRRILAVREIQSSISESVKALIDEEITSLGLEDIFVSTRDEITCLNGSKFIFRGLRDANAINIKSIANIDVTFIEEGEVISEKSWELLIPSVTRRPNPRIIVAFNPRFEEDIVYQKFFVNTPPKKSYIRKLKLGDNPYFFKTQLYEQMLHDRKTMQLSKFRHKWLGELETLDEECLFDSKAFELMTKHSLIYEPSRYYKVVIGVDPAVTNSNHSNQYGIVVSGATKDGEYHCIANYTNHHTPHSFSVEVSKLWEEYKADCVVVETNQGGDFLKASILSVNPHIEVVEVKAVRDKIYRAAPIANLASIGRIKLLPTGRNELIRQMKCTTNVGYTGPKGESPDGLDAFVWSIFELAGLSEKDTTNTVFDINELSTNKEGFDFHGYSRIFIFGNALESCILSYRVEETSNLDMRLRILDCEVKKTKNLSLYGLDCELIHIPNIVAFEAIQSDKRTSYYEVTKYKNLDEFYAVSASKLSSIYLDSMPTRKWKSLEGEILKICLSRFKLDTDSKDLVVETFLRMLDELLR